MDVSRKCRTEKGTIEGKGRRSRLRAKVRFGGNTRVVKVWPSIAIPIGPFHETRRQCWKGVDWRRECQGVVEIVKAGRGVLAHQVKNARRARDAKVLPAICIDVRHINEAINIPH